MCLTRRWTASVRGGLDQYTALLLFVLAVAAVLAITRWNAP